MVFDAHTERVDQYGQQNATCEVTMIDEALQVLPRDATLDCKTATFALHFQRNYMPPESFIIAALQN